MATATLQNNPVLDEELSLFKFTNKQYYVMAELGWFEEIKSRRIELLNGEVWEQFPVHANEPRPFRFSCEQYEQMHELGWFDESHVQLLDGEIVEMSPVGSRHATTVNVIRAILERAFSIGYFARSEQPIRIGALGGEPEPDVAIVRGAILDYLHQNPTTAVLVVEVSESTLATDRIRKAALYAAAGIEEYWIANLNSNQLEVHRAPIYDERGARYEDKQFFTREQTISPLALPDIEIKVADLLP